MAIHIETIINQKECCGCGVCANICPKNAIDMIVNEEGFAYPKINKDKCVECELCKKKCPILNIEESGNNSKKLYACYNKNEKIRKMSSSGGVFLEICSYVISKSGVVFAPAFNKKLEVEYKMIENIDCLDEICGSKYVECKTNKLYQQIKKRLDTNQLVLFSGSPCQVYALKMYLKKEYCNLITQDIVCHGVPSLKLWNKYLKYIKMLDSKFINFRDKKYGWKDFSLLIINKKKKIRLSHNDDPYMQMFLSNLCLRNSCYNCKFKENNYFSDITLGDFWGINEINKNNLDDKGVSLVIINTDNGDKIFSNIKHNFITTENFKFEDVAKYNKALIESTQKNKNREQFFKDMNMYDFDYLINKYTIKKKKYKLIIEYGKKNIKSLLRSFK